MCAENKPRTNERQMITSDNSGITVNGHYISNRDIRERQILELSYTKNRFDQETRENAANELVSALLASCETHEERIQLSISLLGYDPR
jgi:hypothetical protein